MQNLLLDRSSLSQLALPKDSLLIHNGRIDLKNIMNYVKSRIEEKEQSDLLKMNFVTKQHSLKPYKAVHFDKIFNYKIPNFRVDRFQFIEMFVFI